MEKMPIAHIALDAVTDKEYLITDKELEDMRDWEIPETLR